MTLAELKDYFDKNPPPLEVNWKPWAKIINSRVFLENAYMCIENFNGNYERCPEYWHLKELYEDIIADKIQPL
ncbi:DUF6965 family protein [Olivibacter jilunii]|uniref:DUF6965 family protein n=1 Tax=Olivibacter jilunii TaxID=985016 RepID=UPI00102FA6B3|nr:hypothetical protein [Olivibacter jilunii]